MLKTRYLTEREIGQIVALNGQNLPQKEIARIVGRNKSTISRFLANPENYGLKKRTGRPKSLTVRSERSILRAAGTGNMSAKQIKMVQSVPLGVRQIQRIISSSPNLKYVKRKARPALKAQHITARLNWATDKITMGSKWREIVFSDEKKFNLDGPDGNQYYWHDIRKEPEFYSKRQMGGGSVMVWAGFGYNGKTPIVFLEGRQNSNTYIEVLKDNLLPFGEEIGGELWVFQHDNCSFHASGVTKQWLQDNFIRVLDWPSLSPDLNPIENLWGFLVRSVYANGRQYVSVAELRAAIQDSWSKIPDSLLKSLADSMHNRMIEVLKKNGNSINY